MTRIALVLLCLAGIGITLALMWLGWHNRGRRQAGLVVPTPLPASLGEPIAERLSGLYVGSTFARRWQDRIVAHGLGQRASAKLCLYNEGAVIERDGGTPIFLPTMSLRSARLEPALAGKVVGEGGLLVVTWQLGDHAIDTGFRADDKLAYPQWVRMINERVTA